MNINKKITHLIVYLFIFFIISSCGNAAENKSYQNIDTKQAVELIKNKQTLILDVRTLGEYTQGHIKNSFLIPVQVLTTEHIKIMDHKDNPILIYCRSGNRSVTASNILTKNGFKKLYNLKGGIKDWIKNGLPIEKQP